MSFSRVKPGDWLLGDKLDRPQINQIDINLSNAVDKTGDTIPGSIVASGGLSVGTGFTVQPGVPFTHDQLPVFSPPKTVTVTHAISEVVCAYKIGGGAAPFGGIFGHYGGLQGARSFSGLPRGFIVKIPRPIEGSTISLVRIGYQVDAARAALPTQAANFSVEKRLIGAAFGAVSQLLHVPANFPMPASTLPVYKSTDSVNMLCTANNVVSSALYNYFVVVTDEQIDVLDGAPSGTLYNSIAVTYQNVTIARPW